MDFWPLSPPSGFLWIILIQLFYPDNTPLLLKHAIKNDYISYFVAGTPDNYQRYQNWLSITFTFSVIYNCIRESFIHESERMIIYQIGMYIPYGGKHMALH